MKKLLKLICLAAIICVIYLFFTTAHEGAEPVAKRIDTADTEAAQTKSGGEKADDIIEQMKDVGQDAVSRADEAIGDAVKKADEVLDSAVEQADKALGDAIDSAAEGAKEGFLESLKESANEFWESLFH